jgi:DNA modification methylase
MTVTDIAELHSPEAESLAAFISVNAKPLDADNDDYERSPFASDVRSPGRSNFYNLHYYLTKVPPESIVQLLLHYTNPGDLVVDPFCGSGMTGVACQMCAQPDATVLQSTPNGKAGLRSAILNDLSPAACHITYNYTHPADPDLVQSAFDQIGSSIYHEIEHLYRTDHFVPAMGIYDPAGAEVRWHLGEISEDSTSLITASKDARPWQLVGRSEVEEYLGISPEDTTDQWLRIPATLVYVVWSDVYLCEGVKTIEEVSDRINRRTGERVMDKRRVTRGCGRQIVARGTNDRTDDDGNNAFLRCPHPDCDERWMKGRIQRVDVVPVEECLEFTGLTMVRGHLEPKRFRVTRPISANQSRSIAELKSRAIPHYHPTVAVNKNGPRYRRDSLAGKHVQSYPDFFTHRNLWALSLVWNEIDKADERVRSALRFCFTSQVMRCSRLRRMKGSKPGEQLSGTLHIASETVETNIWRVIEKAVADYRNAVAGLNIPQDGRPMVNLGSATDLSRIPTGSIDYIFTDPPFGSNIYYSDVSFMWEAWLGHFTDEANEAIMHRPVDGGYKRIDHYAALMDQAFSEIYRILKPGRHATVEFNNSDGAVFEVIKTGLTKAGFTIENMLVFDKVDRTYAQIRSTTGVSDVVDKDVLFNVHKPAEAGVIYDSTQSDIEREVVDAVTEFLRSLPTRIIEEPAKYSDEHRTTATINSVLMNALIPRGISVERLNLPFIERVCSRYFRKVGQHWYLRGESIGATNGHMLIEEEVSVKDEITAIAWLRQKIDQRPMLVGELKPLWMRATGLLPASVSQELSLDNLLSENFWRDADSNRWREPTDEEREKMNDDRSIRVLHDADRYIAGSLHRATSDGERCDWIELLFKACRQVEEGDMQSAPALRGFDVGEAYRVITRLFQSVLREKVSADAYTRAQKQAAVATNRIAQSVREAEQLQMSERSRLKGPSLFDGVD